MKHFCLLLLFCLTGLLCKGQNLVLNGDFEDYSSCPTTVGQITVLSNVTLPTSGTSDYFNTCSQVGSMVDVPTNHFGYQYDNCGEGYVGFFTLSGFNDYHEYVQLKLAQALTVGTQYKVSFWVSLSDSSTYATNSIGAAFTVGPHFQNNSLTINIPAHYYEESVISNTANWFQVTFDFTANVVYDHIIIGGFLNSQSIVKEQMLTNHPDVNSYYYLDNVSVTLLNQNAVLECVNPVIPNVFTPTVIDGFNDIFVIQNIPQNSSLIIYDRWGAKVYESDDYQNNWNGEGHSQGVYYYILTSPNGKKYQGTVTLL